MRGTKLDFYKANLLNKAKLFIKKPGYILFYLDRLRKYSTTKSFDAFIISYPKSGRTWLQKMLIEAVRLQKGVEIDLADISELNTHIDDFPSLLSTHAGSSWEEIIKDYNQINQDDLDQYNHGKIIYLYRDPRDVLVSQYYHILHRSGYSTFDKQYLIDNPNVGLIKIIHFMNKWATYTQRHPELILPVSYAELKQTPHTYLSDILSHIAYPVSDDNIHKGVENCTMQRMQRAESKDAAHPWSNTSSQSKDNPNSFHSRKGITGEYKTFFSAKEIDHINSLIKSNLDHYYSAYL